MPDTQKLAPVSIIYNLGSDRELKFLKQVCGEEIIVCKEKRLYSPTCSANTLLLFVFSPVTL